MTLENKVIFIFENPFLILFFDKNLIKSKPFTNANIMQTYIFQKQSMTSKVLQGHIRPFNSKYVLKLVCFPYTLQDRCVLYT